jgi:hypothetical protein
MLLALIMLTTLDGSPVWVESSAIIVIRPSISQCHAAHGAAIRVGANAFCVRETPDEIRRKINEPSR